MKAVGPPPGRRTVEICQVLFDNLRIEAVRLTHGEEKRFNDLLVRTYGMDPTLADQLIHFLKKV